ncbi:cobalamin-binding protein [Pedobacter sp. HMWF019]|uniref:ABC transporter substrate-binding protein n=1 Tax=Pedobacter sp. HMWF019 TaxID=2056856 RepID=UPI000D365972|nr:helical backbone metal receptor [Pedobacter sp. HMWF019]PTT03375.1 cobalamin-binding protein [Pedobacter sp. HMWF019]
MPRTFTDQLGREIVIEYPPKRIVSIVPSQTELLFDLGLSNEVIGITKFCVHPESRFKEKVKIGGTKKLNIELIRSLKPDLIIGNKEENEQSQMELLMEEFPVWMSDIADLEGAKHTILQIGELVNREPEAAYLNHLIQVGFADLQVLALQNNLHKKVAYLIWKDPYMFAGQDTFINDVLMRNGLQNVVKMSRYPELGLSDLAELEPDLVFLSSEPYPFKEKHLGQVREMVPGARVMLVDGEMFSWYGSRLVKAVEYFFYLQKELYS